MLNVKHVTVVIRFAAVFAVQTPDPCPPEGRVAIATTQSGYLMLSAGLGSNVRTSGTSTCPWTISVDPYQKIRFYLWTFGSDQQQMSCSRALVFEENEKRIQERLCRSAAPRQVLLFTSNSNRVIVYQTNTISDRPTTVTYLLHYEGASHAYQLRLLQQCFLDHITLKSQFIK